jgi:septal ring factor EnvC (AmiA/AmiB activator)
MNIEEKIKELEVSLSKHQAQIVESKHAAKALEKNIKDFKKLLQKAKEITDGSK